MQERSSLPARSLQGCIPPSPVNERRFIRLPSNKSHLPNHSTARLRCCLTALYFMRCPFTRFLHPQLNGKRLPPKLRKVTIPTLPHLPECGPATSNRNLGVLKSILRVG